MNKLATLTFTIGIGDDLDHDDDQIKELLLEILADQNDHNLFPLITIEEE